MVHGSPDWWGNVPDKTVYGGLDTGELAVRLGSCMTFDRRGNVILIDDFSAGISKGIVYEALANDAVTLHTGESISGPYSVQAYACGEADHMAGMYYERGFPVLSGIGLQFSFGIHADTAYIVWIIERDDATDAYRGEVRYDWVNKRLLYLTAWGVWTPFATAIVASEFSAPFNTGKLVVDFSTDKAVRFLMNERTHGLTDYSVLKIDSTGVVRLSFWGLHVSKSGETADVKLDAFIMTQNEV